MSMFMLIICNCFSRISINSSCFLIQIQWDPKVVSCFLKYGLMLRTPWPLFPCQVLGLHYFDVSCRHRLHKYNHVIFYSYSRKIELPFERTCHWRIQFLQREKRGGAFLHLELLWPRLDFSVKNWDSLFSVRWEGERQSCWERSHHRIIKPPQPRSQVWQEACGAGDTQILTTHLKLPLRSQHPDTCEQMELCTWICALCPHLSCVVILHGNAGDTVPGKLELFPPWLTLPLALPFRNLISKSAHWCKWRLNIFIWTAFIASPLECIPLGVVLGLSNPHVYPPSLTWHLTHESFHQSHESICIQISMFSGSPRGSVIKNLPAMQETRVWSLGQEDPLEKGMAPYSSILAWEIPRTEEPEGYSPWSYKRVGQDLAT